MDTNNGPVTVVKAKKLYHFEDGDFEIPSKIKCPKCGKMVMGYPPLVRERVYKFYDGSWLKYQKEWVCENSQLAQIFSDYNILGVIHGHHLIPASSGMIDFREFMGKELFVLCSIYSSLNNGFDLEPVLKQLIRKQERNDS